MSVPEEQELSQAMTQLYKSLDEIASSEAAKFKTTCKKGCASCCYLLAVAGISDAIVLAEHLLEQQDWKSWLPKLSVAAGKASFEGVSKSTYFRKVIPCVFLDVEQGICKVYDKRPACCRFHWVVSDPKNCSPHAPEDTITDSLNFLRLEEVTWKVDSDVAKSMGWEVQPMAPIPLMVLFMMEYVTRNDLEKHAEVKKYCIGIPDPFEWIRRHLDSVVAEGSGIVGEIDADDYQKARER